MKANYVLFYNKKGSLRLYHRFFKDYKKLVEFIILSNLSLEDCSVYCSTDFTYLLNQYLNT